MAEALWDAGGHPTHHLGVGGIIKKRCAQVLERKEKTMLQGGTQETLRVSQEPYTYNAYLSHQVVAVCGVDPRLGGGPGCSSLGG